MQKREEELGISQSTPSEPSRKTRSCADTAHPQRGSPCIRSLLGDRKRNRRDSQALYAKWRAQVLHRVDTCQPIPSEHPEIFRQLLTSSLPLLSAASRQVRDNASEFGGNSGQRGGAGLPPATSGQLRAGVGGSPVSPTPVCVVCWKKPGMVLRHRRGGQMELSAARLDVVLFLHSDWLLEGLIWIPVFLESQEGWLRCRNYLGRSQPFPDELKILDPNLDVWASSPASHTGLEWHWKDNCRWRTWVQNGLSLVYKANSRHGHEQASSLVNKKMYILLGKLRPLFLPDAPDLEGLGWAEFLFGIFSARQDLGWENKTQGCLWHELLGMDLRTHVLFPPLL